MRTRERFFGAVLALGLAAALGACAGDEGAPPAIDVGAEQEEAMCEILAAGYGTGPVPVDAAAELADAPGISAVPGRRPVVLADLGSDWGGYLRLSVDPANESPVILMFDEPMQFAAVLEDGSPVDLVDATAGSELCPEAAGRYTWYVAGGENYLEFSGADNPTFNLVLEVVD